MQSCREFRNLGLVAMVAGGLAACGGTAETDGAPVRPPDISAVPDAVPRAERPSRYGNPKSYKVFGRRYYVLESSDGYRERGIASWYGTKFHGRRTSSGEPYDMYAMTAAHKTLPLPTYARVTNLNNGRSVVVRVNDRGPFHDNRIIDLSYTAAWKLGVLKTGTGYVEVRALDPRSPTTTAAARPIKVSSPGPVRLYLQAGSFSERANAERMRWRVEAIARDAVQVSPAMVDGRTTYRVRVGPIDTVAKADRLVQRFTELGMDTPRIVIE
jgi:rare lipoprotein A